MNFFSAKREKKKKNPDKNDSYQVPGIRFSWGVWWRTSDALCFRPRTGVGEVVDILAVAINSTYQVHIMGEHSKSDLILSVNVGKIYEFLCVP